MTITPEQRAEMREAGRQAYADWLADHPGEFARADLERQRTVNKLRYKYDPRRRARLITKATRYLPCSCPRVGGFWLETGEIQWRECSGITRFEWSTGHTNWVHRVAAKEFLMGRKLYLRPRAETPDGWSAITPSDPEPLDPRDVLGQLGLANDPESFALKVMQAAKGISSDAQRLPLQRAERRAVEWALDQLRAAGEQAGGPDGEPRRPG